MPLAVSEVGVVRGEDAPPARTTGVKTGKAAQVSDFSAWHEEQKAQIDALIAQMGYRLGFSTDERTGRMICRVIDPETNEVIRQVPPEEMIELAARMDETIGLIFDREL